MRRHKNRRLELFNPRGRGAVYDPVPMRSYTWMLVLVFMHTSVALADEATRAASQPIVINPVAPPRSQAARNGRSGPLVILMGDAAKAQRAAAARAAAHHRRRLRAKMPVIGAR